jgi:hypothetical protein
LKESAKDKAEEMKDRAEAGTRGTSFWT